MQGASSSDAIRWIDDHVSELEPEFIPTARAAGRVLAEDIANPADRPPFDLALSDGFALRGAATRGASSYNVQTFKLVGASLPGAPFGSDQPGSTWGDHLLEEHQAVRIAKGAALPRGADAVLPTEMAGLEGDSLRVQGEAPPGTHVSFRGEDISLDAIVLPTGQKLRPQDIGVLASLGLPQVPVVRHPRVRIVVRGNELLQAGDKPEPFQVYDARGPMLAALVQRDGGEVSQSETMPDDPRLLRMALQDPDVDVLLVCGSCPLPRDDHAADLVAELGNLALRGFAMQPGSSSGLGRIDNRLVFLLPENPVDCLCSYDFFAGRAIRALSGRQRDWPYRSVQLPLRRGVVSARGRVDYVRVVVTASDAEPLDAPAANRGLSSLTRATGFLVLPEESNGVQAGETVEVFVYDTP